MSKYTNDLINIGWNKKFNIKDLLGRKTLLISYIGGNPSFVYLYKKHSKRKTEVEMGSLEYVPGKYYYISDVKSKRRKQLPRLMNGFLAKHGNRKSFLLNIATVNGNKIPFIYKKYGFIKPQTKILHKSSKRGLELRNIPSNEQKQFKAFYDKQ